MSFLLFKIYIVFVNLVNKAFISSLFRFSMWYRLA